MAELDHALYEQIGALSEAGDALAEDEDFEGALAKYREAFDLLPEPKTQWEAGTWLMAAIGDANFFRKTTRPDATISATRCGFPTRSATRSCTCGSVSASSNSVISTARRTS